MIEDRRLLQKLNEYVGKNQSVATVTVVRAEGSTPRGVGSTMLVDEEGNLIAGTIGGGVLEEMGKRDAKNCIERNQNRLIDYDLDKSSESGNALPMVCGGKVSLFIKVYKAQEKIVMCGAGHIAEKLCKIAHILGYYVTVLDHRKERLTPELFPTVDRFVHGNIKGNLKDVDIDHNTYVVIATHGHKFDQDALEAVLRRDAKYIGMIGSLNKIKACFGNLMEKGFTEEELARVHSPIGLDLGGETPEEIALAIMAEIQAVKYSKDAPYLYKSR